MQFRFATAGAISFGSGLARSKDSYTGMAGKRVGVITGSNSQRYGGIIEAIRGATGSVTVLTTSGEPTTESIGDIASSTRSEGVEAIVAIGGGSVIDTGKIVAALLTNDGSLFDYMEVIGKGRPISEQPVPFVAVPTTAGTGAEVTRNSVIGSGEHGVKVSIRSQMLLPTVALVDPDLCLSAPESITVSAGLDALTQLVESYTSPLANPLTDGICLEGLRRFAVGFSSARSHAASGRGSSQATAADRSARSNMSLASLFSGLGLANAKLGAVHGFAGPLGGMIGAAHGEICAALLPEVTRRNIETADETATQRYDTVAQIITGKSRAEASDLSEYLSSLTDDCAVRTLSELGLTTDRVAEAAQKASRSSSMKGNPTVYTHDQLVEILEASL